MCAPVLGSVISGQPYAVNFSMNTYVVVKAIICAQLDILLVPLLRIPMLMRAIRRTPTNSLVCLHFGIFHRPINLSS